MWGLKSIWIVAVLLAVLAIGSPAYAQETPVATPAEPTVNLDQAAEDAIEITQNAAEATVQTVDTLLDRLVAAPKSEVLRVLLVVGGAILLVVGWRISRYVILVAGFLMGAAFAVALVGEADSVMTIAALLLGGLIGAALSYFVYYVAVFLIGAYIGVLLTGGVASVLELTPVSPVVLLIGAILGGIILLGLSVELLVVLSALVGAQMIALGLGLSAEWILILTIVGVLIQIFAARSFNYSWRSRPQRPYRRNLFRRV